MRRLKNSETRHQERITRKSNDFGHKYEEYLKSTYYGPKYASAYSSQDKLYRPVRKEGGFVISWNRRRDRLLKQEDSAVHWEERGKFKRRRVISPYVDFQWDVDTANMEYFKNAVMATHIFYKLWAFYQGLSGHWLCAGELTKRWYRHLNIYSQRVENRQTQEAITGQNSTVNMLNSS